MKKQTKNLLKIAISAIVIGLVITLFAGLFVGKDVISQFSSLVNEMRMKFNDLLLIP